MSEEGLSGRGRVQTRSDKSSSSLGKKDMEYEDMYNILLQSRESQIKAASVPKTTNREHFTSHLTDSVTRSDKSLFGF